MIKSALQQSNKNFYSAIYSLFLTTLLMIATNSANAKKTTADMQSKSSPEVSVILVLKIARDAAGVTREKLFIEELKIVLDDITVKAIDPPDHEFQQKQFKKQIIEVENLINSNNAIAATWLTDIETNKLLLHLVVHGTGDTLIKLVEIKPQKRFEVDLALTTKEFLETALLFIPPKDKRSDAISEITREIKQKAVENISIRPKPGLRFAIIANIALDGLINPQGPGLWLGGSLSFQFPIAAGLFGAVTGFLSDGPYGKSKSNETIEGLKIKPAISLKYLWQIKKLSMGPYVQFYMDIYNINTHIKSAEEATYKGWVPGLSGGINLNVHMISILFFTVNAGLTFPFKSVNFQKELSKDLMLSYGHTGFETLLGFALNLKKTVR
jgi:hypothetical protein